MSDAGGRLSFLKSSGYATVTAASAVMLVALTMIAGRWLPASEYGKFSFALALATIVETLMDIGLGPVTVRTVARDGEGAGTLFRHVLGLKIAWGALGLIALLIAAPLMRSDPTVIRACYLLGISSTIRSYLLSARGLLQGLNRFDLEAITVVADRLLLLVLGVLALVGGYGIYGLSLAFVLARLLMFAIVTLIVKRVTGSARPTYNRAVWMELQTAALPLGFFLITLTLYTYIDTVILGIMRTDAETGWYAASYRVYEGLMYAPSVMAAVLTPRFSYLFVHDGDALRTLFRRSLGASAVLAIAVGGGGLDNPRAVNEDRSAREHLQRWHRRFVGRAVKQHHHRVREHHRGAAHDQRHGGRSQERPLEHRPQPLGIADEQL